MRCSSQGLGFPDLNFVDTAGYSMWPFLKQGTRLIVKKVPVESLRIGDIILYRQKGQLACHRLVKKTKNNKGYLLYARGDNTPCLPQIVGTQVFLGVAIGVLKKGKIINLLTKKRRFIHRIIVIIAPAVSITIKAIQAFS